ncbi:beta-galactosidase [Nonomuraea insulae]|uniref:Beta-galactosidase n=1 Tax=Nonomuraea insulae TaxID=1616787 RepID=A0ABW1CIQ9_9ACTN
MPQLYLVSDSGAANLEAFARRGGVVVVGPYSGIVDEHDRVRLGGYPGAWRDLLGVTVEEFFPLEAPIRLSSGASGSVWSEVAQATTAKVLDTYATGEPAWTRNDYGDGAAHYLTTLLDDDKLAEVLATACREAEAEPAARSVPGVEVVRRSHADGRSFLFAINHTTRDATVTTPSGAAVTVAAGDAVVIPD